MTRSQLHIAILAGVLVLPGLTSCAPVMLAGQASSLLNHPNTATSDGTVLSMRPATPADGQASNRQPSNGNGMGNPAGAMAAGPGGSVAGFGNFASMLVAGLGVGAMPGMSSATAQTPHGPATMFTVRMDDGSTLSVVQDGDLGLHPGDRVQVIHGDRTRLVRQG